MTTNFSDLEALQNDVLNKAEEEDSVNEGNFVAEEKEELTPAEQETIDKMKEEYKDRPILMVTDTDANGNTTQIPAKEFMKSLDKKVTPIGDPADEIAKMDEVIKTVNTGDIKQDIEGMKAEARARTLQAFRTLAADKENIKDYSDDDIVAINNNALKVLQEHFKMERLNSDELVKLLRKMPLDEICKILPEDFWSVYVTKNEVTLRNPGAKERMLAAIAYLTTAGPEFDYLNEYIEEENKLIMVSKRLMQCQIDFSEMIKDEKKLSELVAETYQFLPQDTSIWAKEIKIPDRVHNEFAQRCVIYKHYKEAYQKVMDEYPIDNPDMSDMDRRVNVRARAIIQQEINECDQKMEVYQSVCDLTLFDELLKILIDRFKTNKKINMKYLTQEAERAIESVRRCKQHLPFPGYKGTERKVEQLLANYLVAFPIAIRKYNEAVDKVMSRDDATEEAIGNIQKIGLPEFEDNDTFMIYSLLMVIMMGRILKKCTKNDATKYDAIVLDSYFYIFNRMGTDVYLMNDIWSRMRNLTGYTLQTWYIPEKAAAKKRSGDKK